MNRTSEQPLRVTHAPVNMAGIAYKNVEALKRRGVDARLVVFKPQPFRPTEFDWNLNRPDGFLRAQLTQWRALARLLWGVLAAMAVAPIVLRRGLRHGAPSTTAWWPHRARR